MMAVMETVERKRAVPRRRGLVPVGVGCLLVTAAVVFGLYVTVPKGNEGSGPVDALLVLGTPTGFQGEINPMQIWRVDEAVREFRAGRAPRMVFAGGAAANRFVESDVMAKLAMDRGIPAEAILCERQSHTTVENIFNSAALLRAHGWTSVEVISSRQHLPRAAVLLEHTGLQWRVHAAPTPGWPQGQVAASWVEEAIGTAALRVFGTRAEPVLHLLAVVQHTVAWCFRTAVYKVEGWLGV